MFHHQARREHPARWGRDCSRQRRPSAVFADTLSSSAAAPAVAATHHTAPPRTQSIGRQGRGSRPPASPSPAPPKAAAAATTTKMAAEIGCSARPAWPPRRDGRRHERPRDCVAHIGQQRRARARAVGAAAVTTAAAAATAAAHCVGAPQRGHEVPLEAHPPPGRWRREPPPTGPPARAGRVGRGERAARNGRRRTPPPAAAPRPAAGPRPTRPARHCPPPAARASKGPLRRVTRPAASPSDVAAAGNPPRSRAPWRRPRGG